MKIKLDTNNGPNTNKNIPTPYLNLNIKNRYLTQSTRQPN